MRANSLATSSAAPSLCCLAGPLSPLRGALNAREPETAAAHRQALRFQRKLIGAASSGTRLAKFKDVSTSLLDQARLA